MARKKGDGSGLLGGANATMGPRVKRWAERRSTLKAKRAAREWGQDRGLEGSANPLMFKNRQQYNNIARFLAAAAAAEAQQTGAVGADMWRGVGPQVAPRQTGSTQAGIGSGPARPVGMTGNFANRNWSMPEGVNISRGTDAYGNPMPQFVRDTYRAERAYRGPLGPVGPAQLSGDYNYDENGLQEMPWGAWEQERMFQNPNYRYIGFGQ